jgi:hypothetical protein
MYESMPALVVFPTNRFYHGTHLCLSHAMMSISILYVMVFLCSIA